MADKNNDEKIIVINDNLSVRFTGNIMVTVIWQSASYPHEQKRIILTQGELKAINKLAISLDFYK